MNNKLQGKDLITVGIFTVIYMVFCMIIMITGYIPIFSVLFSILCAVISGIPIMLYLAKVKKFGMVTLMGIICGLLAVVMGSGIIILPFAVVFGVAGDLILKAGKYRSMKYTIIGYAVFSLWLMGFESRMFLLRESFFESLIPSYGQEYVDVLMSFTPPWLFPVLFLATFIAGIIGALLGRAVLKKHFIKAGIV